MGDKIPIPLFWNVVGGITALKLLLMSSYKSTDFEVHRNWLAITYSLPLENWYTEKTSQWTLDYPPFFAWYEFVLAQVARFVDPGMLHVQNLNYDTPLTVLFQRLSVILSDLWFAYGIKQCCGTLDLPSQLRKRDPWINGGFVLTMLLFGNAGLLMIDHIHFQYNGFLFGFLLLSIAKMMQHKYEESAFWFAILLNFKHIFLYLTPVYAVFLLRSHCFTQSNTDGSVRWRSFSIKRFLCLCSIGALVAAVAYGPFIWKGQMGNILSRLFPFKRGLTHAYWAPNFWALYNVLDKMLATVASKLGIIVSNSQTASMTGGLVKEFRHVVLPNITPMIALACTALSLLPLLKHLWEHPNQPKEYLRCLVLCAYSSFLFGWHVHEKAVLMIIIPLTLLALSDRQDANIYLITGLTGHFSLFPLFFATAETPTKALLFLMHGLYSYFSLNLFYREVKFISEPLLASVEKLYLLGFGVIQLYSSVIHQLTGLDQQYPFLPLLLFSLYCSVGIIYSWLKYYQFILNLPLNTWKIYKIQ